MTSGDACPRIANHVSNWHSPTRVFAYLPLIFADCQFVDNLTQFLWPICSKAGHHSIEQKDQGNDRNQIRPEQPRPAEGTNPRSVDEWHESPGKHQPDSQRSALSDLKNADAFAGIDGFLNYGASLFRRKMMKRREHRSKPL